MRERFMILLQRPSSGIAGWLGGRIARIGSEGTRPALLSAGPVPERWNVGLVFIETPHGPAISWTSPFGQYLLESFASQARENTPFGR